MHPNFTVHQLFPILVYQGKIENHLSYKEVFLNTLDKYGFDPTESLKSNGGYTLTGEYRGLCLLHQDPVFKPFFIELTCKIREYLEYLGIDSEQFDVNIVKSWFTIIQDNMTMQFHNHCSSDMSFVYYLDTCGTSGNIVFERPQENFKFLNFTNNLFANNERSFVKKSMEYTSPYYDCVPVEGSLLLFHSSLYHAVRHDTSGHKRISLVGDIKLTLKQDIVNRESGLMSADNWRKF